MHNPGKHLPRDKDRKTVNSGMLKAGSRRCKDSSLKGGEGFYRKAHHEVQALKCQKTQLADENNAYHRLDCRVPDEFEIGGR